MGSKKQVIGYEYGATLHMGLGLAADEVYQIDIGGKVAWTGSIKQNGSVYINQPNLFGGKKGEGGIVGTLDVMFGGQDQAQNGRLVSLLGRFIPAFRHTVTMVFSGILCAMNWYPKPWDFCYRRIKSGWPNNTPWYPEKITIILAGGKIQAMNAAHILYESYVSDTWGSAIPNARMDEEAYKKAADTLYNEGFGLCFEWKATDDLKSFRNYVCDHIGAALGTDPSTGKNTIRLIRDDYKLEDLPTFDEDNGLLEFKFESSNNTEVPSQIIVKYNDAITFEDRPAYANNPAIAQGQTGRSTETIEFLALPTGELATRVGYRELKAKTTGIKRCTIKLDRRAYNIVNGQPFRIKTKYRINNIDIIVRADRRQEKFLTDPAITFNALQDVFSLPKLSFNPIPPAPIPQPPEPPAPITNSLLLEVPYRELAGILDAANLQLLDDSASYIFALATAPSNACYSYDLLTRVKGASNFIEPIDTGTWCPIATIASDIGFTDKVIHIKDSVLLETVEVGTAALINSEIIRIDAIDLTNNQLTVGRGCIDTVPVKTNTGATIWFYDNSETTDAIEYNPSTIVETKLLSNTFTERLAPNLATTQAITIQGRQARPYPPGNLKINDISYPSVINDYLKVSWSHRNRLIQADQLVDTSVGDIAPETGTTYNLNFYVGGTLAHSVRGLTTTSYTWRSVAGEQIDQILMGFENNLTDKAANSWIPTGSPVYVDGKVENNAIRFNSANGLTALTCNDTALLDFSNTIDFTIECWLRVFDNTPNYGCIIASNQSSFNSLARFLMFKGRNVPNNQKNCIVFGGEPYPSQTIVQSTTRLNLNEWYHVAITRAGKVYKLYLNGKLENQATIDTTINLSAGGTLLGRNKWDGDNGLFKGDIDQLRVSKGCIYTSDFTPSTEPYEFNPGSALTEQVTIELEAERDGLVSHQKHHVTVRRG